ncbi:MAG: hypothetical protein V9E94_01305 [Microthrixaceae bacterium]
MQFPLAEVARPAMEELREATGESVQLYVRDGDERVCVAAIESSHGLRTIVAVGAVLPMDRGSAGRALSGEQDARGLDRDGRGAQKRAWCRSPLRSTTTTAGCWLRSAFRVR